MVKWAHRIADIAEIYHGFILDLCSAHNYFTKFAIEQLVENFKPGNKLNKCDWCHDIEPSYIMLAQFVSACN